MTRPLARLLDANANRAREAMRVMEDAARFLLDDARLAGDLKRLRHRFAAAVRSLAAVTRGLEQHRDTPSDVGTTIGTASERTRGGEREVVVAAGKRLTEALRSLEEYGKIISPEAGRAFEAIRYAAYDVEKRLLVRMGAERARQYRLCVILSESLCHRPWQDVARACVEGGADCLQLREKSLPGRQILERALRLVEIAGDLAAVIVNDRPDIAGVAGADGVHLGEHDLPSDAARSFLGPRFVIGVSTHNLREARAAQRWADYCGVGAIFPTSTKPRKPSGLAYLKQFLARYPHKPHLAIGGVTPENVSQVIDAGAKGIAVSSVVCGAEKPATVVRELLRRCDQMPRREGTKKERAADEHG